MSQAEALDNLMRGARLSSGEQERLAAKKLKSTKKRSLNSQESGETGIDDEEVLDGNDGSLRRLKNSKKNADTAKKGESASDTDLINEKPESPSFIIFYLCLNLAAFKDFIADPLADLCTGSLVLAVLGLFLTWVIYPFCLTVPLFIFVRLIESSRTKRFMAKQAAKRIARNMPKIVRFIGYFSVAVVEVIPLIDEFPTETLFVILLFIMAHMEFKKAGKIYEYLEKAEKLAEKIS